MDYRSDGYEFYEHLFELDKNPKNIDYEFMLKCIFAFIKTCVIDVYRGKFTKENEDRTELEFLLNEFKDCPQVTLSAKECCVCNEFTTTVLDDCGHSVCIQCISKIEKKDCERCNGNDSYIMNCEECCGVCKIRKCPMCRGNIIHGFKF